MDDNAQVQQWRKVATEIADAMVEDTMRMLALIQSTQLSERQLMVQLHGSAREPLELAVLATHPTLARTVVVKLNKHQMIEKLFDKLRPPT